MAAIALTVAACAAAPPAPAPPATPPVTPATPPVTPPAEPQTPPQGRASPPDLRPWELQVGEARENRGVAKVEKIGPRWMLTVMCSGQHSTYLDDTTIDLDKYSKGYVTARYRWVTRMVQVKCIKAPCNPQPELRLALERLTVVTATETRAQELVKNCGDAGK
jgi:hypothetical protein